MLIKETVLQAFINDQRISDVLTTEKLNQFAEFAVKGAELEPIQAMRLMIDGYMDNCGLSAGVRTIYYDAGQAIFEKFMKTFDPIAERLRAEDKKWFGECMEDFNELYTKEEYGDYDISIVRWEDYPDMCMTECSYNIPKHMKEALCYGLYLMLTDDFLD